MNEIIWSKCEKFTVFIERFIGISNPVKTQAFKVYSAINPHSSLCGKENV